MAGRPYVASGAGRFQWMMQRVSAVLLLGLVFVHFGIQHFTSDAVTTGLTVSARFNDPWWQAFYVLFVILGLYHGVNGLIGIAYDYMPQPLTRGIISVVLWTLAAVFAVIGITNVVTPTPLTAVKVHYALNGFAEGKTRGNPPMAAEIGYDYRPSFAELPMLRYYLVEHTDQGDDAVAVDTIFGGEDYQIPRDQVPQVSAGFNTWLLGVLAEGPPPAAERDRDEIFSSRYEFALWAANVRRANAGLTGDEDVRQRLADVPAYDPSTH